MTQEPMIITVVLMGLVTVFIVLVCLIGIIKLMGLIMQKVTQGRQAKAAAAAAAVPASVPAAQPVRAAAPAPGNNQQLVAVIAAALAEEMGEQVSRLRIHSIRRL